MIVRSISVSTHGRYLVSPPSAGVAAPLLVGFHGYAETAEAQLERLEAIPGADRWLIVSIQGLNRFYQRRTNEVIAGWMTRQDRELAIADNLVYVAGVIEEVSRGHQVKDEGLVFAGFSQGVAMAFRAASASARQVAGVIAAGGDVPPEIDGRALARIGSALVCRGARDEWYTSEIFDKDVERLGAAGVRVEPLSFKGGHEWSDAVRHAAAAFLRARHP